jgi:type IV pilus assembly protein PilB
MWLPVPPEHVRDKLIEDGLITPEDFDSLVTEANRKDQSLLDVIVSRGIADAGYINNILATYLGVGLANFQSREIDEGIVKSLPEEIARQRQVIAFGREPEGVIDVAMLDPGDLQSIEFLNQYLKAKIKPFLATSDDLNRGFSIYGLQSATDFRKVIEDNIQASLRKQAKSEEESAVDLPIVAAVDNILHYAVSLRASDIHIEVLEENTMIRYRIDGILREIMRIPKSVHPAIVARIKLLAGLKIDEHYSPQDGRFRNRIANQVIDLRVSVMPTYYGEKIVMRLLESTQKPLSLEELGMLPETIGVVLENLKKTYGMIIACGPTGSGKTTTLYALLNILNKSEVNIITVEDPIEYNIRYVNQTQINPQAGITFASGLRAILRQDPNIVMVGEIRDGETAGIAAQAALTGQLVLSSLHTNDATTVIPRLFDLKVPTFLVASTLNVALAQRLARRVCGTCLYSYEPDQEIINIVKDQLKEVGADSESYKIPKLFYRGKGCSVCHESGYKGRLGIYEVLNNTDKLRKVIVDPSFTLELLRQESEKEGRKSMFEDGLEKVGLGMTTIDEVLRVIRD